MKIAFTKLLKFLCVISLFVAQTAFGQTGVLDPNDTTVLYNQSSPPTTPAYGTLAKWVITRSVSWNSDEFKSYFYKGLAFRLKFPKTYQHGVADGKTYPLFLFFHGKGEKGTIYNNDYQLYHGGQKHMNAVDNGDFDGFLLYPQSSTSSGGWGESQFSVIYDLITNYLIPQVKVDPNRILVDGLSAGGSGTWSFTTAYPKLVAGCLPISASSVADQSAANSLKFTPIWLFQGGLDTNPTPFTSNGVKDAFDAVGADFTYTEYPTQGHGCWNTAWAESDYLPFLVRANKVNPWVLGGRTEFCPLDTSSIDLTIGVTAGFDGYEWRKNGVLIDGATSNTIHVTTLGTYDCRIKRGTEWSYWSPVPAEIKVKEGTVSPDIQVSGLASNVVPSPAGNSTVTLEVPDGYASYDWRAVGSSTTISTTRYLDAGPGSYRVNVTEEYGCSSEFSNPFTVVDASGTNKPDAPINLIAAADSKTSISLYWSENPSPAYNETHYEIYQSTAADTGYALIYITDADVTSYIAGDLTSNTTYYYKVRAVNDYAASASATANAKTPTDVVAPSAPADLAITGSTRNSINLSWTAATDDVGVERYDIYINGVKSYFTSETTFTVYNLEFGKTYNFTVKAADHANNLSTFSNQVTGQPIMRGLDYKHYTYTGSWSALPDLSALTPVSTGTVTNVTLDNRVQDDRFAYLWEGVIRIPVAGSYTFRTNSDDGSNLYLGSLNEVSSPYSYSATPLVDNDGLHGGTNVDGTITLAAGTYPIAITYYEQTGGQSMVVSWSTPQTGGSFTTIPDSVFNDAQTIEGTAPVKPTNLTATATAYNSIDLTWTDNSSDESYFEIWRSTGSSGSFVTVGRTLANDTTFTDSTLEAGTTYNYRVRAINKYGESEFDKDGNGVDYSYYENTGATLSAMPDFSTLTPVATGRVGSFDVGVAQREDDFELKYDGYINVPTDGTYTFYTSSDDGSKLYIGEFNESNLVVNNDGLHGTTEKSGTKTLTAGFHEIHVTFFERGGGQVLTVSYQGPGISKQVIPSSVLGEPYTSATTFALPDAPAVPSDLEATGVSTSAIHISWTDNADNEASFELYRSATTNANYVKLATLDANTTSYLDSGLFSNSAYYYKIRAINLGGNSAYSNEDSAVSLNNLPVLAPIYAQNMRFGTQLELSLAPTDADNEQLHTEVTGLPSFGVFVEGSNGSGTITFSPAETDLGTYDSIQVQVTDLHGGVTTQFFSLVVTDNYSPVISGSGNTSVAEGSTATLVLTATDQNATDSVEWSFVNLPSFVTKVINEDTVTLTMKPGFADGGTYAVTALASDGRGGTDSSSFTITVTDVDPNKSIFVNFNSGTTQATGIWNNTNKQVPAQNDVYGPFKDSTGTQTNTAILVTSTWNVGIGSNESGAKTGNNTGVYPDVVMQSAYWSSTLQQTFKVTGLDTGKVHLYNLTFFGSRGSVTDNRTSVYTVNGQSVSLNAASNTQTTVTISGIKPDADGSITVSLKNGTGSSYSYLNAMVIRDIYNDSTAPAAPKNVAVALTAQNAGAKLTWNDVAYNETGYQVYRATDSNGVYTLIATTAAQAVTYTDETIVGNSTFYYKVRSVNAIGTSAYSGVLQVVVPNAPPAITAISNQTMYGGDTLSIPVTASYSVGNTVSISGVSLPAFATVTDNGSGNGTLSLTPASAQTGSYTINIVATDNHGGADTATFALVVQNKDLTIINVNFNQTSAVGTPWNSFTANPVAGTAISNLKDANNNSTGINVTLSEAWGGASEVGVVTGNNSGIYPDDVMKTTYFDASSNVKHIVISGLSASKKYNLVFFGSRVASDTRITNYSVGSETVSLNVSNNSTNSVQLNGLLASASGTITVNVVKASSSPYTYINAMVIQAYENSTKPLAPANLVAVGTSRTSTKMTWSDQANNETGYEVWRATAVTGSHDVLVPYTLVKTLAANATSYADSGLTKGTNYLYKVRAITATDSSDFSNEATAGTFSYMVYMNFNRENPAAAPWNNTNTVPTPISAFYNLLSDDGNPTGINIAVDRTFSGDNPYGMVTGDNSGIYPDNVMSVTWWIDAGDSAILKVNGLNSAMMYNFVFFGSRNGGGDNADRTTVYSIGGSSASLNCTDNISQTAQINNVTADDNGAVYITIKKGAYSSYGYLGALVIQAANSFDAPVVNMREINNLITSTDSTSDDGVIENAITVYPNPFYGELKLNLSLKQQTDLRVTVTDIAGHLVAVKDLKNVPKGKSLQPLDLQAVSLKPGLYFVKIGGWPDGKSKVFKLIKQ